MGTKIYCDNKYCSWSEGGICTKDFIQMIIGIDKNNFGIRYCSERNINKKKDLK